ncbi:MAG: ribosome assembly cofactor RimP [Bacteroidota bacterium]
MFKEKVEELLNRALAKREDLFLLDFTVGGDNTIKIVLDGDKGISLNDCMEISRAIEHNLDREEEDFSLEVTSAGATTPLMLPRQYKKNVGRRLEVVANAVKMEGKLIQVTNEGITLEWKAREPKPVGKGKHTVEKKQEVAFSEIERAKVVLKF